MAQKKYVSLSKLQTFLDNLKDTFASLSHKHTISDITDFVVDSELSSTSTNPVQNKVLDAEFEAVSEAMSALESSIDSKADAAHSHTISEVTNLQTSLDSKVPTSRTINGKALTANITLSASDVGADVSGSADTALASAKSYADSGDATTLSSAKTYTDTSIENMVLITVDDIDAICGSSIVAASEVTF